MRFPFSYLVGCIYPDDWADVVSGFLLWNVSSQGGGWAVSCASCKVRRVGEIQKQ